MTATTDTQIKEQMQSLVDKLNQASDAYYNGRGELMSDHEWDALFDQLRELEERTGVVLPLSPTQRVSEDKVVGQKEEHEFPALSLAKTKRTDELVKWADGRPIWLSWKLDGLTLVVTYDKGQLTKVVTRGNGHIGTNITRLATAIKGIPATINYTGHLVARGEAVISYDDFEAYNVESDEAYANPRNLASGSLTLHDLEEVRRRKLRWMPFTLVYADDAPNSWGERMDWLQQMGMTPVERQCVEQPTLENVQEVIDQWTVHVTGVGGERTNPYPVDGLVIVFDDTAFAQTGSVTGHHATRAGLAFKWQDESAQTTLDHIEWSCAASTISPVAVFAPVQLEGTTVRRASLCNISECRRLGIGGKGSKLEVIKANKIIPKVIRVVEAQGELHIPSQCPVCQAATEVVRSANSDTITLHCTNEACPAKQLRKFGRLVSKEAINIDGLSEQTIAKLMNKGWVTEFADLFHLSNHAAALAQMEGFGKRSTQKLLTAIECARTVEARRLLYALSIPLCGQEVCSRLLSNMSLNELVNLATTHTSILGNVVSLSPVEQLSALPGIGVEKASSIVNWFANPANKQSFERLMAELNVTEEKKTPKGERCQGLTFVITGDVHHYKNRAELKQYIESQGGKVVGSVSKNTNYLINNDVESTSGKNQKARELGTPILSEDDFVAQFAS